MTSDRSLTSSVSPWRTSIRSDHDTSRRRQVGDAREAGVAKPRRVPARDSETGRLLEARAGEQHPRREVAELGVGAGAEARLGDDGGHEVGGVAVRAQARHDPCDVVGGVH